MTPKASSATRPADEESVSINLAQEQIDEIARQMIRQGSMPWWTDGFEQRDDTIAQVASGPLLEDRRLSRSVLIGLLILACFIPAGTERRLTDVAHMLNLPASSIHRYVRTLVAVGLLEQALITREYRLAVGGAGPHATHV
jgi:IclR helix-turn-helix domain